MPRRAMVATLTCAALATAGCMSSAPVGALEAPIDRSHQDLVAPGAGAWASVEPGMEARAGDIQRIAQPCHRPDGPVLRDESEPHIASLAKKAAAFFLDVTLRLQLRDFLAQPIDLELLRLHLTVPGKGTLRVVAKIADPVAQHRRQGISTR